MHSARGTPSAKKEPTTSSHDDEMLENELESIFSAGKIAMKGIFKDEVQDNEVNSHNDSLKKVIFVPNGFVYCVGLLTLPNPALNSSSNSNHIFLSTRAPMRFRNI